MAFQEVNSLETDTTTQLGGVNRKTNKKNPTSIEGYLLGSKKVDSTKSKSGFAYLHVLQTSSGNVGVWGKTDMDRKLLTVPAGSMIRVTHTGMQATKNGEMYKYKVEVDADNTIEVSSSAETEESNSHSGSSFESVEDEDDSENEEEALQAAALAAAERKAKVAALLGGKGKSIKN